MIPNKSALDFFKITRNNTDIKTFLQQNREVLKIFDQQDSGYFCGSLGIGNL